MEFPLCINMVLIWYKFGVNMVQVWYEYGIIWYKKYLTKKSFKKANWAFQVKKLTSMLKISMEIAD